MRITSVHILERKDGGVEVMQCLGGTTPEQALAKWHPTRRAEIAAVRPATPADIPADRTFRDAWRHTSGKIAVHMPTARDIHRSRIRSARAPRLAALDGEYQRADEKADAAAKAAVSTKKQALRDAPADPAIEAATTPEQLRAVWPKALDD